MEKIQPRALPIIHAILICDKIITEANNKKKSLIGIFDTVYYTQLPLHWPELWVYVNLSDVLRQYSANIELVCLQDNRKILEIKGTLKPKKQPNWELAFRFKDIIFHKKGVYAFRFWVDEDVIGEKYIYLRSAK
jgi:hypothetical protein